MAKSCNSQALRRSYYGGRHFCVDAFCTASADRVPLWRRQGSGIGSSRRATIPMIPTEDGDGDKGGGGEDGGAGRGPAGAGAGAGCGGGSGGANGANGATGAAGAGRGGAGGRGRGTSADRRSRGQVPRIYACTLDLCSFEWGQAWHQATCARKRTCTFARTHTQVPRSNIRAVW
eukprot:4426828-Pleurochrysis_carterae.AAC.2